MEQVQVKDVIRTNKDGIDINYGQLVASTIDGIPFIGEKLNFEIWKLPFVVMKNIPEFIQDIVIKVWSVNGRDFSFYALEKEDIAPLGLAFSKRMPDRVAAVHRARMLQQWEHGEVASPHRTLDHWYTGLTQEEIEYSRF